MDVSRSSLATFAYRDKNYQLAEELWLADGRTQHAEYRSAKAYLTRFPECIDLFVQPGDNAEILRQWKRHKPSDAIIRGLPTRTAHIVSDAALDQNNLDIAATIMHSHPHLDRVGKLLSAAVRVQSDPVVYEGARAAVRLFVQAGAWNDVVDAESLRSISRLAEVPIGDILSALRRLGKVTAILETIISELATSNELVDSAPKVVVTFLHRICIGRDTRRRDLDIPPHVVGAAIERSGKIVDALQYYKNLSQDGRNDIKRFAAERLVRNHKRYAHYFETTRNMQQAQNHYNLANQIRKEWGIDDSNLDEFPIVRTPSTDSDGLLSFQRQRRGRAELQRSLRNPHPETRMFAETGEAEWFAGLPDGDEDLVDPAAGQAVRWIPGEGWVEE